MREREFYLEKISKLLKLCDLDTIKALYAVISNMTERSRVYEREDHCLNSKNRR